MIEILVQVSKIIMILLLCLYTIECFTVMTRKDAEVREQIINRQRKFAFMLHFLAYLIMFAVKMDIKYLVFYAVQVLIFTLFLNLYDLFYEKASPLVVNNMVLLLMIGLIMLTRLNFEHAIRQFVFIVAAIVLCVLVPLIIHKLTFLDKLTWVYAAVGILALLVVFATATVTGGAKLSIDLGPVSIQPSEFVKITYVFFVACMLYKNTEFKQVLITTAVAATHVLILVASRDLGGALILFVAYMVMTFVATKDIRYFLIIFAGGCLASVMAYFLFSHVQIRVANWLDPFSDITGTGLQLSQSLFAIGTGGWLGLGLFQGMPKSIPVVESDFIFSAISEEMGLIFALSMLLVCISCFIMFLNIALQIKNQFYKLIALGLGCVYGFQVFLMVGGVTKFIPSTGVTLPLISYGGSSIVSTVIIFSIIEGLYILREDEGEFFAKKRRKTREKAQKGRKEKEQ
ncbi:MAG: FtsW/RodA/SpoVE family cell cycle protein [Lachnospiraceae bacterium]|nr:FtsW/RodA/SpoVE family cell cycle protein [Lachnospiraceae bacterium]